MRRNNNVQNQQGRQNGRPCTRNPTQLLTMPPKKKASSIKMNKVRRRQTQFFYPRCARSTPACGWLGSCVCRLSTRVGGRSWTRPRTLPLPFNHSRRKRQGGGAIRHTPYGIQCFSHPSPTFARQGRVFMECLTSQPRRLATRFALQGKAYSATRVALYHATKVRRDIRTSNSLRS